MRKKPKPKKRHSPGAAFGKYFSWAFFLLFLIFIYNDSLSCYLSIVAINTTITEIARRTGPENTQEASTHETNKIYDRYCQFQDDTALNIPQTVNDYKWGVFVNQLAYKFGKVE